MPTVPTAASAAQTASRNDIPIMGSSASKTRRLAKTSRDFGIANFRATASPRISRARSAAWIAAFPIMSVTRLE